MTNEGDTLGDTTNNTTEDTHANKVQIEDDEAHIRNKNPTDPRVHRKSTRNASHWQSAANKRRRTSLLGNLAAQGRLSRGLSIQKLMLHLTASERAKKTADNLPPEDYYIYDEADSMGIFLEPAKDIPDESTLATLQQMMSTMQAQQSEKQEGEGETAAATEPSPDLLVPPTEEPVVVELPENVVFPVDRNTVELRSKLCIVRSLKTYLQHNHIDEGKCYYAEDELDLSFLTAKPKTFLIFGKPGIGKTTLATRLAEKLHAVHLNPENIIEYFRGPKEPLGSTKVNEILENGESIGDGAVIELLEKRIREFDILHRGYVLEGFPMITSDDLPVFEQLEALSRLAVPPEYLIILQMQDKDLYKRRISQKFDPETGKVYTQQQYSKTVPDEFIFDRHYHEPVTDKRVSIISNDLPQSISELALTEELSDTEKEEESRKTRESTPEHDKSDTNELDFPQLTPHVLERLFYRTEDFNIIVNDDLESFRFNFQDLQLYVQNFNKRKILEVDAYWAPHVIFRKVWEFCETTGIQPVPVPVEIVKSLNMMYFKKRDSLNAGEGMNEDDDYDDDDDADDEIDGDDGDGETICPDDDQLHETDWVAALRAVTVRGLVDPRFRWRVSRWINLCPVALKLGRSIPGRPELAVSFMDKVFFMSSKRAADQFINNPRPYLLPKMPTSPVKFIVIGHPLAGKTTFANELARITEATVIDVNREINKRFNDVKRDFIWKKRLRYSLEATHIVNKENSLRWHRQERARRRDMHAWIENHLKQLAEAEIEAALERDRDVLHKIRTELRKESEYHAVGEPFGGDGMCQGVDATLRFNWKKFVQQAFGGKSDWTHQELLQLAWDLFHQGRLYYKKRKRDSVKMTVFNDFTSESDEEFGLVSNNVGKESVSMESSGSNPFDLADEADVEYEGEGSPFDDVLEEETDDEEEKKKAKKKKRKKKRKCIRIEVKPVLPEDIIEPFLFDTFDVDPDDPEVEESVRMRFPLIPFELVDIVPAPPQIGDTDAAVQRVVEDKLEKDAHHVDGMPPDIFVEILRRACADVEVKLRRQNRRGPMTGGWIIENFPPDIEKWRALLRTPEVCPDQVFLLLDLTEESMIIWSRFKKLFRMLHPPKPETRSGSTNPKRSVEQVTGEDGQQDTSVTSGKFSAKGGSRNVTPFAGEDGPEPEPVVDPLTTENETEQEEVTTKEVERPSLSLVSKSHFILSLLPKDDLLDKMSMTSSEVAVIHRDQNRHLTTEVSEKDSGDELLKIVEGHEKYIWDSMEKDFAESEQGSFSSLDFEEHQKGLVLKFKPLYVEMSACLEELDAFQHTGDAARVSSNSEVTKTVQHPPPGTPETGMHSEPEDFSVPVPPEIAAGEIELTPEEMELRTVLENDIRRLSSFTDKDDIQTPTEMASILSINEQSDSTQTENEMIIQKLLTTKIESPKRKFFAQIRIFNEFWNMALPVCNQQGVRYWEVGLCDEESALEKSIFIWNELESRFDAKAKKILETELREEDDEILASLMRWGEPYDLNDMRFRPAMKQTPPDEEDISQDTDDDGGSNTNDDSEGNESDIMKDKDGLTALDNKPNLYWKETKRLEAERCFGDFKYYCPVTYADSFVLRKGSPKFACKYKDRLYYCSDENNQLRFLVNPQQFLPTGGPPPPPAPRICITGSPGCLQEEIASQLCNEFKVCYVNFRQRLHEIMKARFGREIGPNKTGQIVSLEVTRKILSSSKPDDDMLYSEGMHRGLHFDDTFLGESQYDSEVDVDLTFVPVLLPNVSGILTIPKQEMNNEGEQKSIQETALKSLGLLSETSIETVPLNSIQRTEKLTERKWQKLTRIETYIQGFLENGIQLPDDILDEFIAPLWKERPFTEVGFILVGFPNTEADIQYLVKRNFIPEHVIVMECKSIVIRNRLIVPTVDRWHKEQNPSGKVKRKLTRRTNLAKLKLGLAAAGIGASQSGVFQYQTEGRQDVDEYEIETWDYNDSLSRDIARALKFYHGIYSAGLEKLKKTLNRERVCWTPVDTNTGLQMGKHSVINSIIPMLKYRNNVFEDVCRLSFPAAQSLLDRGVFTLSRLHRWCPVELSKGNTGINIWNAPGIKKIPYLHRRFIYFLEGEKNAKHFEENTWNLTTQAPPLQPIPLYCMVLGHPKSGKTSLAKKLAQRLGLLYISGLEAIESVVTHAFVSQWGHALSEVNPALAAAGHQPMTLANEVLEYIREGRSIPRYVLYRCLDLLFMNPKAQCHGVVFDDFPTILDELIEINYREMTPCLVIDLKIPIDEAYSRCDANRKHELRPDQIPEESHDCMDYLWDTYENTTLETLRWFSEEYQNVHAIDGRLNPEMIYKQAAELCIKGQKKVQEYCINLFYGKPNTLEGTCPLTSTLFHRLTTDFGFFCPVALNDSDELVSVKEISDLSQVVEYKGQIYLFSGRNAVRKFMNNPKRYTVPGCLRTPPSDISQPLMVTPEDFERLREHWGFMDFDPVLYYANHHYKGLQRGDPKYCVVYRGKLYVFISEENQKKFMRKPPKYWNLLLPMKIPRKTEPINYDRITPFAYLSAKGMIPILRKLVKLMAEKRPRVQFMNVDQCAALYMGYYLKSQNMNSPFQRRQKYRDAMFKMSTMKSTTKDFLNELHHHYGCRQRNLPERLRQKLDEFIKFEHLSTEEKVLIPKIPGVEFGYDAVRKPFSEPQVARKVRKMMERMKEVDMREKLDAFSTHSKRKKVSEEAAERAAQDAKEAAELARKIEERSQARLKMKSLTGSRAKSLALSSVYTTSFGGKTNFS